VGGDLYDVAMTQFGPCFIIGDVKGKGLDAVGRCAAVLAVFRELAFGQPDLGAAVKRVVRLLLEHSGDGLTDDVLLVLGEPLARM
jgi:stage II sporulation SpoE-like protein